MDDERPRQKINNIDGKKITRTVGAVFLILFLIIAIKSSYVQIDTTEVGVVKVLGKIQDETLGPGPHFVKPFITEVIKYPTNIQQLSFTKAEARPFTSEGLEVGIDMSVQYRIMPDKAVQVYKTLRGHYEQKLRSIVLADLREIVPGYSSEELYNPESRQKMSAELTKKISEDFAKYGFEVIRVNVEHVQLPPEIEKSIEAKIQAKQEAERYQYLVQKEKLEAERKKIEAEGIAQANKIIAQSIDENYIKWYYMEVLKEFAQSQNNAIIVVPVPSSYYEDINLTQVIQPPMIINGGRG